jgi:Arc/MetJ-type ribon-helix-helix transcriptional regulator
MISGMTAKSKIAVSLPPHLVKAAKTAVRSGRAPNVSAYVADALAEKVMLDDLDSLLETMLAESGGPMTNAERRAADRILRGKHRTR